MQPDKLKPKIAGGKFVWEKHFPHLKAINFEAATKRKIFRNLLWNINFRIFVSILTITAEWTWKNKTAANAITRETFFRSQTRVYLFIFIVHKCKCFESRCHHDACKCPHAYGLSQQVTYLRGQRGQKIVNMTNVISALAYRNAFEFMTRKQRINFNPRHSFTPQGRIMKSATKKTNK